MRRICVVTGSRAEYGLLRWLMREIAAESELALQLVVTGTHLSERHGLTVDEIEADGHRIDARVPLELDDDSRLAVAGAMGQAVIGLAEAFARLRPDLIVLLGDRFETLAAAEAALVMGCPIAHLHGGELTEGAMDDSFRHAITKMASLHFVAAAPFRDRVVQLGEAPERVFVVGALALDAIEQLDLLDRATLERELDFILKSPCFLVTYHPETLTGRDQGLAIAELLQAIDAFPNASVVFTRPNADPGNAAIAQAIDAWVAAQPGRGCCFTSLGQRRYLSLIDVCDAAVGNSSSALIEAPVLHTPSVNIGNRQAGRPRAESVIDCSAESDAIREALETALSPGFQQKVLSATSPYGSPGAAQRIVSVLREVQLDTLSGKRFHDLKVPA